MEAEVIMNAAQLIADAINGLGVAVVIGAIIIGAWS